MILSGFISRTKCNLARIQEMCLMFVKWFHWILNEFIVSYVCQVVSLDFE
jgi:hypothetical protein